MAVIIPKVRYDRTTTAQNKAVARLLRKLISDMKLKIKRFEIIITFLNGRETVQEGIDLLVEEIHEEMKHEVIGGKRHG